MIIKYQVLVHVRYNVDIDAKRGFAEINSNSYRDNHNRKKNYSSFGIG